MADAVFRVIRKAIVRHDLPPGLHLSVPALALQLGTSRSPVHEAIKRLVHEGLATEAPRRGAFVTTYSLSALVPLYEVRWALEGLAASLAAERASDGAILAMRQLLDEQDSAIRRDDMEKHVELDVQFHRLILDSAANPPLHGMLDDIYERIHTAMMSRVVRTGPTVAFADHQAILHAIAARDGAAAGAAATRHVMRVYGLLVAGRAVHSFDSPPTPTAPAAP